MTEPAPQHRTSAASATLPIDEQIDSLFEGLFEAASEEQQEHFQREVDALHPALRNVGLGRKLIRLRREMERIGHEELLYLGEVERARKRVREQMRQIELVFEAEAREHRLAGNGNRLEIVGVGTWSTRRKPARWSVENETVIEALDADLKAEFTELPEPKPPEPKLKGKEFRRFLDEHFLDEQGNPKGELPEGVERVEAEITVDYDLLW